MNELDRIRKLAGILTESVMAVPGLGIKENESDMQTAATGEDNAAYAAANAASPQLTEASTSEAQITINNPNFNPEDDNSPEEIDVTVYYSISGEYVPARINYTDSDHPAEYPELYIDAIIDEAGNDLTNLLDQNTLKYIEDTIWDEVNNQEPDYSDYERDDFYENEEQDDGNSWAEHKAKEHDKNKDLEDGSEFDPKLGESAPPGMEDMVLKLKKQYPGEPEKAFATAWSIYNKKHGKTEESTVMEEYDEHVTSAMNRFSDLINNWVDYPEALDIVVRELDEAGIDAAKIDEIVDAINVEYGEFDSEGDMSDMDADSDALASAGHGTDDDYGYASDVYEGDPDIPMDQHLANKEKERQQFLQNYKRQEAERNRMKADRAVSSYERNKQPTPSVAEDLSNGYNDVEYANGQDYFPDGADSPVTTGTGPSGARQGDNPEQKKMEIAEAHKELVYNYRKFLKESATK